MLAVVCIQIVINLTILGHYVIVPKKVPEFIVPDLTDFEVSFHIHFVDSTVILFEFFFHTSQHRVHPMISYSTIRLSRLLSHIARQVTFVLLFFFYTLAQTICFISFSKSCLSTSQWKQFITRGNRKSTEYSVQRNTIVHHKLKFPSITEIRLTGHWKEFKVHSK